MGQADDLAHAEEAHHLACKGRRVFEVVLGSGADFAQDELFRGPTAEQASDSIDQVRAGLAGTGLRWGAEACSPGPPGLAERC